LLPRPTRPRCLVGRFVHTARTYGSSSMIMTGARDVDGASLIIYSISSLVSPAPCCPDPLDPDVCSVAAVYMSICARDVDGCGFKASILQPSPWHAARVFALPVSWLVF
jgi:hypothetical protein